eukprot:superscaffoldBa00000483_g5082
MDENTLKLLVKLTQEGQCGSLEEHITSGGSAAVQAVCCKHFGRSGDTLLHYAARHGHLDIVEYLIKRVGMDVEVYNNDYKRPRVGGCHDWAIEYGSCNPAMVQLETCHFPEGLYDIRARTPLMMACTRRNLDVIQELLCHGADPALRNKDGWNSFHIACREGDPLVIQHLLLIAPDVWKTESGTRRTPLHTAAMHGCEEVVRILLERCGYTPDVRDSCGVTPFMDAVRNGHLSVARLLLEEHQASPTAADVLGTQPVHQVAVTGEDEALRFLVRDLNVDVNQRATGIQLTALHYAAKEGHTSTIKTLLELGADLHARDKKGRTALHMASIGQHADAARTLLQLGLKDSEDTSGITARQHAKRPDLVRVFECGSSDRNS